MEFPFGNGDLRAPRAFVEKARALSVLIAVLALSACSGGAPTRENPVPPTSANPDPPTEPDPPADPDPPTDPDPPVTTATVMWTPPVANVDGSPLLNLAGYRIYYGRSRDGLSDVIDLDNPGLTAYTVEDLSVGTWYFAVTAYSTQNAESERSQVSSKTLE